jgi:hypothetical protein
MSGSLVAGRRERGRPGPFPSPEACGRMVGVTEETGGLSAGMYAAADAIALIRARLTGNNAEADRILAETGNHAALSADLAYMVTFVLQQLPEALTDEYLGQMLRRMQDNALDVELDN